MIFLKRSIEQQGYICGSRLNLKLRQKLLKITLRLCHAKVRLPPPSLTKRIGECRDVIAVHPV